MRIIYDPDDNEDFGRPIETPAVFRGHAVAQLPSLCTTYRFGQVLRQEYDCPFLNLRFLFIRMTTGGHIYLKRNDPVVLLQYPLRPILPFDESALSAGRTPSSHLRVIKTRPLPLILSAGFSGHMFMELGDDFRHSVYQAFPEIASSVRDNTAEYHSAPVPLNYEVVEIIRKLRLQENSYDSDRSSLFDSAMHLLRKFYQGYLRTETPYQARPNPYRDKVINIRNEILYAPNVRNHTLELLAQKYDIPRGMLWRKFYNLYGTTVTAFVHGIAMEKSQLLLMTTELPIQDIARTVGYSQEKNFSRSFKQYFKMSPQQMRLRFGSGRKEY